jgi:hypothetical protein
MEPWRRLDLKGQNQRLLGVYLPLLRNSLSSPDVAPEFPTQLVPLYVK